MRDPRGLTALVSVFCSMLWIAPAAAQEAPAPPAVSEEVRREVERQLKEIEAKRWTAGMNPQGGGAFLKSPDGKAYFRLYGYAQPTFTYTDEDNGLAFEESEFRVRRARVDFTADFDERYKVFLEYDGASSDGTALVEAWAQAAWRKDRHFVRAGKFIVPFSTENNRSSRALDTVERFLALNSLFALPAVDVQIGAMLWGHLDAAKRLTYYAGAWNGNASAGASVISGQRGNARDNNGDKEIQARLNYKWTKELATGIAFDLDREPEQLLQLASYSGGRFLGVPVAGDRRGLDIDAHWKRDRLSFDSEWLQAEWEDSDAELTGGYVQAAWWARGSEAAGGVQAVLRAETAELGGEAADALDGRRIVAATAGANVWLNGWTRWQINLIGEKFDGRGNGSFRAGSGWRPTFLSQLQVKF